MYDTDEGRLRDILATLEALAAELISMLSFCPKIIYLGGGPSRRQANVWYLRTYLHMYVCKAVGRVLHIRTKL